jgi:hypothetical protein
VVGNQGTRKNALHYPLHCNQEVHAMTDTMLMWVEVVFNVLYLLTVWGLVIAMTRRLDEVRTTNLPVARYFILAFALLALGDTGHVGFRVWAYALGNLEAEISLFGFNLGLVGLGALSTAITVTLFYLVMLFIWSAHFRQPLGIFGAILILSVGARFVIMAFPQNQWNSTVPPQPWSIWRNLPLVVLGLGVAYLILRDARKQADRTFMWIGIMILVSYAFYAPVILFVQQIPVIGMLMIPKTLAYVAIAIIAYRSIFQGREQFMKEPAID